MKHWRKMSSSYVKTFLTDSALQAQTWTLLAICILLTQTPSLYTLRLRNPCLTEVGTRRVQIITSPEIWLVSIEKILWKLENLAEPVAVPCLSGSCLFHLRCFLTRLNNLSFVTKVSERNVVTSLIWTPIYGSWRGSKDGHQKTCVFTKKSDQYAVKIC